MSDNFGLKIGVEGEKDFKNALKDINQSFKVLGSEMTLVAAQFDKQDKSIQAITARNAVLNKEIDQQKTKIDTLKQALQNANDSFGQNDKRTQEWAIQLNHAEAGLIGMEKELGKSIMALDEADKEMDDAGNEAGELGKSVDQAGDELEEAGNEADQFGDEIDEASKKTSIFGEVLKANLVSDAIKAGLKALASLVREVIDGFKAAINVGMEFESAFAGVKKTVEATDAELAELEKGIREMAMEIPATAAELSGMAEMAGQLGIKKESILGFTRTMADLGNATNLSGEEAAKTFAQFANITKMDQGEFQNLGSAIVALGNNFATTEADIANMAKNLASAGTQIGMSQADIVGMATALSSLGLEAQAGGTAMSRMFVDMQVAAETGGDKLKSFAKIAGMSADAFAKKFKTDASGAITAFITGLSDTERNGKSAIAVLDEMGITETRLRDSLLRATNANELFAGAIEMSNQAWKDNTALTHEAAQRYETMESQVAILKNTVKDFGIEIYQSVQEPMMDIVKQGQTYMKQLNTAFQEGGFKGLVDEAGKVLSDILTKITAFAPQIVEGAVSMIGTLIEGINASMPQIAAAAVSILNPLIRGLLDSLPLLVESAITLITTLASGIGDALPELVPAIVEAVLFIATTLIENLDKILEAAMKIIVGLAQGLINALPKLMEMLPKIITTIVDFITNNLPKIVEMGVKLVLELGVGLIKAIPQLVASIPKIIAAIVEGLGKALAPVLDIGKNIVKGLWDGISSMVSWITGKVKDFVGGIVSGVKGLLGIKSPSTVFKGIGTNMAQGVGIGFVGAMDQVTKDIQNAVPTDFDFDPGIDVPSGGTGGGKGGRGVFGGVGASGPLVVVQQMIVRSEDDIRRVSQELYNLMQSGSRAQGQVAPA